MNASDRPTADDVRKAVKDDGIEFLFANFVDMHARPSAKLIPAEELEGLFTDGAGFAGLRRRRHRPATQRPRHDRHARRRLVHEAALEAERRLVRLERHGRGRGMAVLPAHDPAPPDGALRGDGLPVQDRLRARVLPAAADGGRRHRDRRQARHPRASLLRHPRADPELRLRLRGDQERQLARLGAVRHRPRGRQRPVRAELRPVRPADKQRSRRLLPLHGGGDGAGARPDRHLHAEAVRRPDRQRLPHAHEPLGRRHQRLARRPRQGRARAWD